MIRKITEETKTTIDIQDDGTVNIGSNNAENTQKAIDWIRSLTREVEAGEIYTGKVTRIMPFGAFVEILPGKEGLVHISELANYRVPTVEDVVNIGDEVQVLVTEIDRQGRVNLSRRALLEPSEDGARGRRRRPRPQRRRRRRPAAATRSTSDAAAAMATVAAAAVAGGGYRRPRPRPAPRRWRRLSRRPRSGLRERVPARAPAEPTAARSTASDRAARLVKRSPRQPCEPAPARETRARRLRVESAHDPRHRRRASTAASAGS